MHSVNYFIREYFIIIRYNNRSVSYRYLAGYRVSFDWVERELLNTTISLMYYPMIKVNRKSINSKSKEKIISSLKKETMQIELTYAKRVNEFQDTHAYVSEPLGLSVDSIGPSTIRYSCSMHRLKRGNSHH